MNYDYEFVGTGFRKNAKVHHYIVIMIINYIIQFDNQKRMINYDSEFLGTGFKKNSKVQHYIVNMKINYII